MFDRTSRKTIPQALDSNEAQDVSFCDPPNGPPRFGRRPTARSTDQDRTAAGVEKASPLRRRVATRVDINHRSVVAPAQGRKK
jgi:hypothetical protein